MGHHLTITKKYRVRDGGATISWTVYNKPRDCPPPLSTFSTFLFVRVSPHHVGSRFCQSFADFLAEFRQIKGGILLQPVQDNPHKQAFIAADDSFLSLRRTFLVLLIFIHIRFHHAAGHLVQAEKENILLGRAKQMQKGILPFHALPGNICQTICR